MRVADVLAFDPSGVRIGPAVQFGLVGGAVLVVGSLAAGREAGVDAAAGALNAVAGAGKGITRPRSTMIVASAAMGLAAFVGSLAASPAWLHVVVAAALALFAGTFLSGSASASAVSALMLIGFVLFGRFPLSPAHAAAAAGVVLLGGLAEPAVYSAVTLARKPGRDALRALWPRRWPSAVRGASPTGQLPPGREVVWPAVRLAGALAAAEIIAGYSGQQRAYWVALTVVLVLRSDLRSTRIRGLQRVIGTLIGATMVGLLVDLARPGVIVTTVLVVVLSIGMYAVQFAAYWIYAAQLAAVVVLLFGLVTPDGVITAADRAVFTTIGGVLAVGTSFVFRPRRRPSSATT